MPTGAVTAIMLAIGHGSDDAITGLQDITIVGALPFVIIMIVLCIALFKDLRSDPLVARAEAGKELVESAVIAGTVAQGEHFELTFEAAEPHQPDPVPGDGGGSGTRERADAAIRS